MRYSFLHLKLRASNNPDVSERVSVLWTREIVLSIVYLTLTLCLATPFWCEILIDIFPWWGETTSAKCSQATSTKWLTKYKYKWLIRCRYSICTQIIMKSPWRLHIQNFTTRSRLTRSVPQIPHSDRGYSRLPQLLKPAPAKIVLLLS